MKEKIPFGVRLLMWFFQLMALAVGCFCLAIIWVELVPACKQMWQTTGWEEAFPFGFLIMLGVLCAVGMICCGVFGPFSGFWSWNKKSEVNPYGFTKIDRPRT